MRNVRVVLQIRVCVELARDEVVELLCVGGVGKGQTVDGGVENAGQSRSDAIIDIDRRRSSLCLADGKGKLEV